MKKFTTLIKAILLIGFSTATAAGVSNPLWHELKGKGGLFVLGLWATILLTLNHLSDIDRCLKDTDSSFIILTLSFVDIKKLLSKAWA